MRRAHLGASALALLGCALLSDCSLATGGTGDGSPPPANEGGGGGGLGGGSGSGAGLAGAGAGGAGTQAGAGGGGSGGGAGSPGGAGGAGGTGGGAGAGGAPPVAPIVLGCTPWLPSDPAWALGGDARREATRIVLTPPDAPNRQRWGQAYLPFLVEPVNELEVAFTVLVEPGGAGGAGDDYALGAAFWFATPSDPFPPPDPTLDLAFGVPLAAGGVALALDFRPAAPPNDAPFWGLYTNPFNDNRTLAGFVADGVTAGRSPLGAGAPRGGPHTASVRMRRVSQPLDTDDVDVDATVVAPAGPAPIGTSFDDGEDEVLGGGVVGFSAGSGAGPGALHALLGVEIKVDGGCRNPPR